MADKIIHHVYRYKIAFFSLYFAPERSDNCLNLVNLDLQAVVKKVKTVLICQNVLTNSVWSAHSLHLQGHFKSIARTKKYQLLKKRRKSFFGKKLSKEKT
jgi:hypothetical protein